LSLRIATFNLENLDETAPDERASLAERVGLMKRSGYGRASANADPGSAVASGGPTR